MTHKVNLEVPKNRKYSPFHVMFCRDSSWVLQCPDLTRIKREAQSKDLKMLFDTAKEIQKEMLDQVDKRRKNLVRTVEAPKLKKNDKVRIKKFAVGKDVNKKEFRPFSECTWTVRNINPFTNTCLVMEDVEDGFQPRQRRIHARFLRKILPVIDSKGDDLSLSPMTETEEPGEEPLKGEVNDDKQIYEDELPSDQTKTKEKRRNNVTTKQIKKKLEKKQVRKKTAIEHSRHPMKLRSRK